MEQNISEVIHKNISLINEELTVCIISSGEMQYSETFIRMHIESFPIKVIHKTIPWNEAMYPSLYKKSISKQFLLENNIDVVFAEFGYSGVAVMEVCQEIELPLIVHFHGVDVNEIQVISGEIGQQYPKLFKNAEVLITPSQFLAERLLKLGAPSQKIRVNYNGVNTSFFNAGNPKLSPPIFISVSRFVNVKGPHLSLLAFKKVVDSCQEARLIMIGDGLLLESCKQLVKALKISSYVQFLGAKKHWEVRDIMHSGRALIQHSIRTSTGQCEALGIVFLEAGASGLPVVATHSGGISEVILDKETGFLVEEGDVDSMAEYMLQLAKNPTLAAKLGQAARKRICNTFSMEKSKSGLWKIVETAIRQKQINHLTKQLNLGTINYIVFPDWSQTEELVYAHLEAVVKAILNQPNTNDITLLIDTSNISEDEASLAISGVLMNLLLSENLEVSDALEISLLGKLNLYQWQVLLPYIHYRIFIETENEQAINKFGIQNIPSMRIDKSTHNLISMFISSSEYWERRYIYGGNSGSGSYGHLAKFKAEFINQFIVKHQIKTVIEFGCGDGNQLKYSNYLQYIGLDISQVAINICQEKFKNDLTKSFLLYTPYIFKKQSQINKADLALSLDVIFHLVEDDIFYLYMEHLFTYANQFVIIYSSNYDQQYTNDAHVRHRNFTDYVEQNFKNWILAKKVNNKYPVNKFKEQGSFSDFYIYTKSQTGD